MGKDLEKSSVRIHANISSQFITSLLLVAGKLKNGLNIELEGEITSRPYLEMTLALLKEVGIENDFQGNTIQVEPFSQEKSVKTISVESDWSSASYYYSFVAIGRKPITLKTFKKNSLQGDSVIGEMYAELFGVETVFNEEEHSIKLIPIENFEFPKTIEINMNSCPDIAQTICVTASALQIPFHITGLATLS